MRGIWIKAAIIIMAVLMLSGCDSIRVSADAADADPPVTALSMIPNSAWLYNEEDDVFYQLGIKYCEFPSGNGIQELAVFVPGRYMYEEFNGKDSGTYTCSVDPYTDSGRFCALDAPVVISAGNHGYSGRPALTEYTREARDFTDAGYIYVYAGFRGREQGKLADVADLKAAIRYIRLNQDNIPGDMSRIFCMGMAEGGARSMLLGITGDSPLYEKELKKIGAIEGVSDSVLGAQAWCPAASPEMADEAYEWMMGNTRTGLSEDNRQISDEMAASYAEYINGLGLKDQDGDKLTLTQSDDGRFQAGTYYDYILEIIEQSLRNYLLDTVFPTTTSGGTVKHPFSDTFNSAAEYIRALNADGEWVSYDISGNKVSISSVADFTMACKPAVNRLKASGGTEEGGPEADGSDNALSPLYFLLPSREGYNTTHVAKFFRINSGLWQTNTSLCTEANLSVALQDYGSQVKFTTVWGMKHTTAERNGTGTAHFINWIDQCCV